MTVERVPNISFPYEPTLDHDPEINPATDYLIQCQRCGEWRHRSWFRVHHPACAACMQFERLYLDNLTFELAMRDPYGMMPEFVPMAPTRADAKLPPLRSDRPVKKQRRR